MREADFVKMKLVVRTKSLTYSNDPAGFRSSDRCAPLVRAFCHWHGIPYEDTFVSIELKVEKHSPLRAVGKRTTHGIDEGFGEYPIELDERQLAQTPGVGGLRFPEGTLLWCRCVRGVTPHPARAGW